jgi:ATP-dependent phosphoenolpyruvate carboxykinase
LYEEALQFEAGTALTSSGALVTDSGAKKGRSPKDKRIVEESSSVDDVWVRGLLQTVVEKLIYYI